MRSSAFHPQRRSRPYRIRILDCFEIALPIGHGWVAREIKSAFRVGTAFTWTPDEASPPLTTFLLADVTADFMEPMVSATCDDDILALDAILREKTEREWMPEGIGILGFGPIWFSDGGRVRSLIFSYIMAEPGEPFLQVMENRFCAGMSKILIRSSHRTGRDCSSRLAVEALYAGLDLGAL